MQNNDLNTLIEFLNIPLQNSDYVFGKFAEIPGAIHRGEGSRQFLYIKGQRENKVLLVAHADTVWDKYYANDSVLPQDLIEINGIIRNRNGGLGADDRAGCAILWLLKNTGHSLLITNGEEHGQIGSNWLKKMNQDIFEELNQDHQFVIQFDRRNALDFKCYDVGTDEFRSYVGRKTAYKEPDRRSYTDIVTLCNEICGVNLSIGYYNEHRIREYLVISEWLNTLNVCRKWLAEMELPKFVLS